ncbi:hypothetical protein DM01DRAFT_1384297 [Hesseltinella vesiculosa]|uniref:Class E vacuolar protein-sorting machinery protein HSE1 n=1 Tax=Hesseltinella vesiculosa TaxID=101127 RepID=A0A1X2GEU6_9FUNG|nr:hypothetical protein DM01DRAFT_1384297 [Hesseltinella vesiculosa]
MFSKPNPFEELVISATDENLTSENWDSILLVCEKASNGPPDSARDCLLAVQKRLTHRNANVQLYALALSDALVKNCNVTVHREISSRAFTNTLTKLIRDRMTHDQVRTKALELIQTCSFEFRGDSSLGLMNDVYHSLRAEGVAFPNPQKPKKEFSPSELDKQKEEEEFQLALALSLSESENRTTFRASSSTAAASSTAAPASSTTAAQPASAPATSAPQQEPKVSRVRALYDFQTAEEDELGFQKGDIIRVVESVFRDWWKGELRGKTGIFPVNYVEKIVDPTPADLMKEAQLEADVINELASVDRLLDILNTIDPTKDSFSDNDELQSLYNRSLAIRPKLVSLIEKYSLKKDELVALNDKFLNARSMYDRMLNDSIARYSTGVPPATYNYNQPAANYPGYPTQQPQQQYANAPYPQQQSALPYQAPAPPMSPQLQQPQTQYTYQQPQQLQQPMSPSLQQQPPVYPTFDGQQQGYPPQPQQGGYPPQQQPYPPSTPLAQHPPAVGMSPPQNYGQPVSLPASSQFPQHAQPYAPTY